MSRDWHEWHRSYDDPQSHLNRRLEVVVAAIRAFLDEAPPGPLRCLSLCAGQARDVSAAALGHPRRGDVVGAAIELDPELAAVARANLAAADLSVDVRTADAGAPANYADVLPVDLLLLVGIFGNIDDRDIERTVAAVPALCRPGATVIWTRHRRPPDVTPRVRAWFAAAGMTESGFVSPGPGAFSVGAARVERVVGTALPDRLFTFRPE